MGFTYSNKLFGGAGSGVGLPSGALTAGRVVLAAGPDSITDDAGLSYNAATDTLTFGALTLPSDVTAITLRAVGDTILTSPSAATIQLGGANSATPVSQTLQVQGSRGGIDVNVPGGNLTLRSGPGTGTGIGSTVSIQTPGTTTSGSDQQNLVTRVVFDNLVGSRFLTAVVPYAGDDYSLGSAQRPWQYVYTARGLLNSKSKTLTDGSATAFATVALADGAMTAGEIIYRVTATITGQKQVLAGRVRYSAVREGTTYDVDVAEVGTQTTSVTTGTLTGSITAAAAGGLLTFSANFDSDRTAPTVTLNYRFDSTDTISPTPL